MLLLILVEGKVDTVVYLLVHDMVYLLAHGMVYLVELNMEHIVEGQVVADQ